MQKCKSRSTGSACALGTADIATRASVRGDKSMGDCEKASCGCEKPDAAQKKAALAKRLALVRKQRATKARSGKLGNQIPEDILRDPELEEALKQLPSNYDFQVLKTVWKLRQAKATRVAIQMPEGLLMFACILSDIFEQIAGVKETVVLGDVTYGACCVDDYGARALQCDFMIHYGHSCLVPIDVTSRAGDSEGSSSLKLLYVFVDIKIDVEHFVECVKLTVVDQSTRLYVLGTIQFAQSLNRAQTLLQTYYDEVVVPQARPLSSGEVLGCTAPNLECKNGDVMLFIADGRFHMESAMIANPKLRAYRYNPYDKVLSQESYDSRLMKSIRYRNIELARKAQRWGIIMGTLGRQGNPAIVRRVKQLLQKHRKEFILVLLSETFPSKLSIMDNQIDAWVQISCPRLSIDWGSAFTKPLLTPYETFVTFQEVEWKEIYPQDFYASGSGPWTNYFGRK